MHETNESFLDEKEMAYFLINCQILINWHKS